MGRGKQPTSPVVANFDAVMSRCRVSPKALPLQLTDEEMTYMVWEPGTPDPIVAASLEKFTAERTADELYEVLMSHPKLKNDWAFTYLAADSLLTKTIEKKAVRPAVQEISGALQGFADTFSLKMQSKRMLGKTQVALQQEILDHARSFLATYSFNMERMITETTDSAAEAAIDYLSQVAYRQQKQILKVLELDNLGELGPRDFKEIVGKWLYAYLNQDPQMALARMTSEAKRALQLI